MSQIRGAFLKSEVDTTHGLTRREYYAAKALQGLLANPALAHQIWNDDSGWKINGDISSISVDFADILMIALE